MWVKDTMECYSGISLNTELFKLILKTDLCILLQCRHLSPAGA